MGIAWTGKRIRFIKALGYGNNSGARVRRNTQKLTAGLHLIPQRRIKRCFCGWSSEALLLPSWGLTVQSGTRTARAAFMARGGFCLF